MTDEQLQAEYQFLQELKLWLREQDKKASDRQQEIRKELDRENWEENLTKEDIENL